MGLDSLEILMKVEDTFGIKIPDQDAQKILTIGDFHNAVWRHLSGKYSDKCKSQILFYKLKRSIFEKFGYSPSKFLLQTSPEEIFPIENRRQVYFSFSSDIALKLPKLILTKSWLNVLTIFGMLAILGGLGVALILIIFFNLSNWMLLIPIVGLLLTLGFSELLNPRRVLISATNIREFTEQTLALNYAALFTDIGTNRREMEKVINYIVADMAGLDLEEVTTDKKISDDLGID
jgi:acyl carrier protein